MLTEEAAEDEAQKKESELNKQPKIQSEKLVKIEPICRA